MLNLEELLPKMVNTIVNSYGFYYAGIFLLDENGEWAHLRAGYGDAGKAMLADGHKLKVGGNSMIGTCIYLNEARIALDVGEERVHFKNPHLPATRSEMALPLYYGKTPLGAVTVQSVEERAFSQDDITTLQTMADHLAVAINNAYTLQALKSAHAELPRTKVYEALTVATTEAIHCIGNKALPISMTIQRLKEEQAAGSLDPESLREDLDLIAESAEMIVNVKEQLIGQAREQKPRPVLLADVLAAAARQRGVKVPVQVSIAPEAAYIMPASTQITRALGNLLQNAAEAGAGQITVSAAPTGEGSLQITIRDNGAGMNPEALSKAWTPFFTTRAGHHGLGLPAALHVVTQLQGQIGIHSKPGETDIEMQLPAGQPAPADLSHSPSICLLDDDDAWAQFFTQAVPSAQRAAAPQPADLLVLDENAENFHNLLEAVHQAGLAGKTVIVTAAMDVDRMTRLLRSGIKDVKLKPYSPAEIAALWAK